MKTKLTALMLGLVMLVGCAKLVHAPVPGSANTFDSDSYIALVGTYTLITQTQAALAAGQFPASIAGNVKTALNDVITYYDKADLAYIAYHTSALAGTATPAQQASVQAGISATQLAVSNLVTAKGAH